MMETDHSITSYESDLNILYKLNSEVAKYRSGAKGAKIAEIFSSYIPAVGIAASSSGVLEKELFDTLMKPFKDEIVKNISSDTLAVLSNITDLSFINESVAKKLNGVIKISQRLAVAKKTSPKATEEITDTPLVAELKQEIISCLNSRKKIFDAQRNQIDIEQALELVAKAETIKIKHTANQNGDPSIGIRGDFYELQIDGLDKLSTIIGRTSTSTGSKFRCLSEESAQELMDKIKVGKSKSFDTAIKLGAKQQQNQQKDKQKKEAKAQEAGKKLIEEAKKLIVGFVETMDSKILYEALAVDKKMGKKLLSTLTLQTDGALQDRLYGRLLDAVVLDQNVWDLYKHDEGKGYYESLPLKVTTKRDVAEVVEQFMEGPNSQTARTKAVSQIAGMRLPREVAQNLFVKEVFEYGMAPSSNTPFSEEKFDQMNDVLQHYGYKIEFCAIRAEQSASDARTASTAVLNDMHNGGAKARKNKTIALMYRLGEAMAKYPSKDLSSPYMTEETSALYKTFCEMYYPDSGKNADYSSEWKKFVKSEKNKQSAKAIFELFTSEAKFRGTEQAPELLKEWIGRLSEGQSREEGSGRGDGHHIWERKFAGLFKNNVELFGNLQNIGITDKFHESDVDMHRKAHFLDVKETYFYIHNGKYKKGSISGIATGDIVLMPRVLCQNEKGEWRPIIEYDTLLTVPQGSAIASPDVPEAKKRGIGDVLREQGVTISRFSAIKDGAISYLPQALSTTRGTSNSRCA